MLYTNYQSLKKLNRNLNGLKFLLNDYSIETMPHWICFQNTYSCNLSCPHCQFHGTEEAKKKYNDKILNMKDELLKKVASEVLPFAGEYMLTVGGEPLVLKGIENTIHELEKYGAKLHLITNGTLLRKRMLEILLPYTGGYYISIDGATESTFETLRKGAKFKKVLKNVKLLKRSLELLSLENENLVILAFTIMGSNIQEMPEMVRLASFWGVNTVNGNFVVIMHDHVAHEAIEFHKPRYNYYYTKAKELATDLDINFDFPPPFEGVAPDPTYNHNFDQMIIKKGLNDSNRIPPPYRSYLNLPQVEAEALELATAIRNKNANRKQIEYDETNKDLYGKMKIVYEKLIHENKNLLQELTAKLDQKVKFCNYLFRTAYVASKGEVSPCCIGGRPDMGNVSHNSMFQVWNGEKFNNFRKSYFSQNPEPCCQTCQYNVNIPLMSIFQQFALPLSYD
ncbi:radical SAM/SPASM domain-containing protein [candidate division CSSED10-310 bacterium]|uniref:Radical SAM/SPASM domain-containing protein n=1 Tax=candidate division CSSED10-310 bacterium TaxID=2855610 RepID=A0ABV6YVP2_UNCC1